MSVKRKALVKRRWTRKAKLLKPLRLNEKNKALKEGRTIFPSTVQTPNADEWMFKSGGNNPKLGSHVLRGEWEGFPIYVLTLEERASCPRACQHWRTCYGNKMHRAVRWRHGPELVQRLTIEVEALSLMHPRGWVARLHELGDFWSAEYVEQWANWLDRYPAIRVFGYTHWRRDDPVGAALAKLIDARWDRFAIRWSDSDEQEKCAGTIEYIPETTTVSGAIVCPEQDHLNNQPGMSCGSCTLCWSTTRNVVFVIH
jgi:hypothetical protein